VHSLDGLLAVKKVEAGGELIGPKRPTWLVYAHQFGLSLNELPECDEAESPILLNGRRLVGNEVARLWSALDQVLQSMNGDDRQRHELPAGLIQLSSHVGGDCGRWRRGVLSETENNRCDTGSQSLTDTLAGAIGAGHIQLRTPVAAIEPRGPIAQLSP
jgi:hypothetical protein